MTNTIQVLTAEGNECTAGIETGKHGGPVLAVRYPSGLLIMALKVEHVSDTILGTVFDPGTVQTVRDSLHV